MLYESTLADGHRASFETWRRNVGLEIISLEAVLRALHIQEFISWEGGSIEAGGGAAVWKDYLRSVIAWSERANHGRWLWLKLSPAL